MLYSYLYFFPLSCKEDNTAIEKVKKQNFVFVLVDDLG